MGCRTNAEILYEAVALLDGEELSGKDKQLLRAAQYRIEVLLGDKPRPASGSDLAANAYAVKMGELVE